LVQQLHNARYQSGETTIRYRFHPRYGEGVVVAGRNRHGDEVTLLIRQPEGTFAQLPIWMTENQAEAMIVTEHPRLPLAYLFELRRELDACLSLLRDDSRRDEGGKDEASPTQSPPTRPLRAQVAASAGKCYRAEQAAVPGQRATVGNSRGFRSDGGR
jgi:hypothetical protein